jgi:hypothetical protein
VGRWVIVVRRMVTMPTWVMTLERARPYLQSEVRDVEGGLGVPMKTKNKR